MYKSQLWVLRVLFTIMEAKGLVDPLVPVRSLIDRHYHRNEGATCHVIKFSVNGVNIVALSFGLFNIFIPHLEVDKGQKQWLISYHIERKHGISIQIVQTSETLPIHKVLDRLFLIIIPMHMQAHGHRVVIVGVHHQSFVGLVASLIGG